MWEFRLANVYLQGFNLCSPYHALLPLETIPLQLSGTTLQFSHHPFHLLMFGNAPEEDLQKNMQCTENKMSSLIFLFSMEKWSIKSKWRSIRCNRKQLSLSVSSKNRSLQVWQQQCWGSSLISSSPPKCPTPWRIGLNTTLWDLLKKIIMYN